MEKTRLTTGLLAVLLLALSAGACAPPTEPRVPNQQDEERDPNDNDDKPAFRLIMTETSRLA